MTEYNTTPSGQPLGISHRPSPCRELFTRFKAQDKPAFIGYLPFGFPTMEQSLEAFATMVENGADIVEIGLPYSDPVMDGPVIQAASQIALNNGERIADVFKAVETVDECVGRVVEATLKMGGIAMVTADHGNAEVMLQPDGSPMTAHTTNLVPFILCGAGNELRPGRLADIAPTILDVMGLAAPQEMDGQTLIVK